MLPITDSLHQILEHDSPKTDTAGRYQANPPPVVIWNVTNTCNMACPHCYSTAKRAVSADELSHEDALQLVDDLAAAGIRVLIFSGGEPLLRPDLFDLIQKANEQGIHCQLSTNGVLIDPAAAGRLKSAGVRYVGVSIDGLPDVNDTYRGLDGAYERALDGIRNSMRAGINAGLRITVSRINVSHVDSLLELCIKENIQRFYVSHLVYSGRGAGFSRNDLSPDEARAFVTHLFDRALELVERRSPVRIVTGGNDSDGVLLLLYVMQRYGEAATARLQTLLARRGGNSAGEKVINIDHKGNVHPDQFWRSVSMGNVKEDSLLSILKSPLVETLRNRTRYLKGKCASCAALPLCRGSHRERAEAAFGDIWAEDPSCILTDQDQNILAARENAAAGATA
ncbi:MAG: radical SAM protein [Spirochaetia bacterium]|nr:radical SAM protein [Spirochaetia bacterium]